MNPPTLRKLAFALLGLLVAGLACQPLTPFFPTPTPAGVTVAPVPGTATPETQEPDARYQRIFERVWTLVNENYVYPDYNGVDWDAIWSEYNTRVALAPDDAAFWDLMREMIQRLDDHHSIYLTPEEAVKEDQEASGNLDYVGIGIYVTVPEEADYGVILLTFPDSPAEAAGIRAHDRILTIDGQPACCNADDSDNLDLIGGVEGTPVTLTLQTPDAAPREVVVPRARIQTQLPIPTRRIATPAGDMGYLLIPTLWDNSIAERTRTALSNLLEEDPIIGLVIDMRINGGGAYAQLHNLLSLFADGNVGHFQLRGDETEPLDITPRPIKNTQTLPLVILIGPETESYAEVFSGSLQAVGRATLIGEATAGNVETIYRYDLEDGSRLWLAQETFVPADGARWEGVGVQPDVQVSGRWEDITEADDPALQAALDALQSAP